MIDKRTYSLQGRLGQSARKVEEKLKIEIKASN
jgi:hypothetical protein